MAMTEEERRERKRIAAAKYRMLFPEKVRESKARSVANNPKKYREMENKWRKSHLEQTRATGRKHAKKYAMKYPDKIKARMVTYRRDNADKIAKRKREYRLENREHIRIMMSSYRLQHKKERRMYESKRNAAKRNASGRGVNVHDVDLQLLSQKNRCWWCGKRLAKSGYHIDHRVALINGGEHDPSNIVISCSRCNLSKGTKTPLAFCGKLL